METLLESLSENPERWPIARENDVFDAEIRELHFGLRGKPTHRAIFQVSGEDVIVYAVRHLAQADLGADDLGN